MDGPRGQNDFARWYYGLPPVSRTVLFASFLTSIAPLLQLIHPYQIFNIWPMTFKGQLWRPFTASLYAGGGIEMLMGLFFFYNHSKDLETEKFTRTADYAFFLTFCWAIIVVISYFIDGYLYFNAVSMSVAYVWSQMNRDRQMSFMGFIPMKAMWLPVSMLVMTFVMNGPGSAFQMQLVGLVAGHTYLFVTEIYPGSHGVRPLLQTPTWFARLFGNAVHARMRTMPYGTAFNPRNRQTGAGDAAAGHATGFGSATSSSTAFRGAGYRLGDS